VEKVVAKDLRTPAVAETKGSESREAQKDRAFPRAKQAEKRREAKGKADDDTRHGEDKTRAAAKKEEGADTLKQLTANANKYFPPAKLTDYVAGPNREEADKRSVYIGQVDYAATPEELQRHFKSCGQISRVTILADKVSGKPKGFAYLEFANERSVQKSLLLDGSLFLGRELKVMKKRTNVPRHQLKGDDDTRHAGDKARTIFTIMARANVENRAAKVKQLTEQGDDPHREEVNKRSVYVGQVEYGATREELQDHFKSCGQISRVTIWVDKFSGKPKGFAFVEFASVKSIKASLLLNGSLFRGRQLEVKQKRSPWRQLKADDERLHLDEDKARTKGKKETTGKIVAVHDVEQDMEQTLEFIRQRYLKPERVVETPRQHAPVVAVAERSESPEEPKPQEPTDRQTARKAARREKQAEKKLEYKAANSKEMESAFVAEKNSKKVAAQNQKEMALAPKKTMEKMVAQGQKERAKAAGPEAGKQDIDQTLELLRQRYAEILTPADKAKAKKEDKAKAHAEKAAADKATREKVAAADKPAAKKIDAKAGKDAPKAVAKVAADKATREKAAAADKPAAKKIVVQAAPKAVAKAAAPQADKEDIELTLERLRQRYMQPEKPTGKKIRAEAGQAAAKAVTKKVAAEKPAAKEILVEVAFPKRAPTDNRQKPRRTAVAQ